MGRLSKAFPLAALCLAVVALVLALVALSSSRHAGGNVEALRADVAREQAEATATQAKAMTTLSQRVTDAAAKATAGADLAPGVADLATRVSALEEESESYARALEFLDSKYPQARLDEDVVGRVVESGRFTILESGLPVGVETYELFRTEDGYALVTKTDRTDGRWGAGLSQVLRLDEALRPSAVRVEGTLGAKARNERAEIGTDEVKLTTATGRVVAEKLATSEKLAAIDLEFASPFIVLHRALGTPEEETDVAVREAVTGKAVRTLYGNIASLSLTKPVAVSILSADVRKLGYRHDVDLGEDVARYYVLDGTVIAVEFPATTRFVYRSDLFPDGFQVESRAILDIALPDEIREQEIAFSNDGQKLYGTITAPTTIAGKIPLLFLVPDLGAFDADGDIVGYQTRIGRELARGLAVRGVSVYRFDRRGIGASEGDYAATSLASLISDARVALALLRGVPFVDAAKIYAVGIGRGGILAGMLAASGAVSGVVTLSTSPDSLGAAWREQLESALAREALPAADVALFTEREEAFQNLVRTSTGTWDDLTFAEVRRSLPWMTELEYARRAAALPLPLLRDLLDADPLATFGAVTKTTLVVQGDKDVWVSTDDAFAITAAINAAQEGSATLSIVPDLNHILRPHTAPAAAGDAHLEKNVDLRVLELIADWCGVESDMGAPGRLPSAM